jgi:hypothetical protein
MSIEAMKQALEALDGLSEPYDVLKAQHALRTAIAEAEKQEPFGYFQYAPHFDAWVQNRDSNTGVAFYTTPPAAQRQPLTREQALKLWGPRSDGPENHEIISFTRAIEAAHGITGEKPDAA